MRAAPAAPAETGGLTPEDLFRSHARYVAVIAFRLLGRRDEVDDLVQDVFLAAHESLATLREPGAVRGWLATITVRKARRRLRVRRFWRTIGVVREPSVDASLATGEAGPYTHTLVGELFASLDRVPANQRIAWSLRYLENEPLEVVAARCGCSLATAKRWIAAASARLDDGGGDVEV